MKVDVYFTPHEINEEKVKDHVAVVVDVLRTSTTICAALAAGAKEIIPVESVAAAIQLASNLTRDAILLCGEREGRLIEGFDLGNSPLEYTPNAVKGKTLVFGSTNGSPAVVKTRLANCTYIGGFVNLGSLMAALSRCSRPVHIICAGKLGQFALEDAVCSGYLLQELRSCLPDKLELSDAARAALSLADHHQQDFPAVVADSDHGRYLAAIGMSADVAVCAELNRYPVLPVYQDGKIHWQKEKTDADR